MNLKRAVLSLVIASLPAHQAQAQTVGNNLRGVNQIKLLFENLDEDQKECQITEALIRDAFMYPASSARFVVVQEGLGLPSMYFSITTLLLNSRQVCFSSINMQLRVNQQVTLEASGRNIFATIQLWAGSWVQSSVKARHAQAMRSVIEDATKKFVTDWNLDNK